MTNPFDPKRLEPTDGEEYARTLSAWISNDKPRKFSFGGIQWMQIVDVQGICFVPVRPDNGFGDYYSESSYGSRG